MAKVLASNRQLSCMKTTLSPSHADNKMSTLTELPTETK